LEKKLNAKYCISQFTGIAILIALIVARSVTDGRHLKAIRQNNKDEYSVKWTYHYCWYYSWV